MSDWRERALCAEVDPELFFPEGQGASSNEAKRVCAACDVIDACLAFALAEGPFDGVWGGTSAFERRGMSDGRERRKAVSTERARFARLAASRGAETCDIADHLGVDENTVSRYLKGDAA